MEVGKIQLWPLVDDVTRECVGAFSGGRSEPHLIPAGGQMILFGVRRSIWFGPLCIDCWPDAEGHFEAIKTEFPHDLSAADIQEAMQKIKTRHQSLSRKPWAGEKA